MIADEELARFPDTFNGDDARLTQCIEALLSLDATGTLAPHGIGGHAHGLLSAAMHRLASQSRAAGVQGADELLRSENPDRKDFTVDEALRIADQNDAAYKHAPSVSRTLAAEVRRLATPQPPKDAGAVPMPAEPVLFDDRTGEWGFDADQLRAYGDAREASGRADSVLSFNREHAAKRIADSILRSPTNNTDENNDSVALLDVLANAFGDKTVGPAMDWMIDAVFVALEDFPQHPPAEPAARAQPIDEDHPENWPAWLQDLVASTAQTATDAARAQVVGYRWRNSDHQPWTLGETVSGFDLNSREIGAAIEPLGVVTSAHPSPAHAGAGDAEAVDESALMKYARSRGWPVTLSKSVPVGDGTWYHNWDITIPTHELAKFFPARRLAGGKAENPQKCGASVDDIRGRRYCILSWSHAGPHFAPVGGDHA